MIEEDETIRLWAKEMSELSVALNWEPFTHQKIAGKDRVLSIDNSNKLENLHLQDIASSLKTFTAKAMKQGFSEEEATREFERDLCKKDLYYLTKFVLGYDLLKFHLHYPLCKSRDEIEKTPNYRGLLELPRGFFKSTICTIAYIIQRILKDPNVTICILSNTAKNADDKLVETKDHFIRNEQLRYLFPEYCCTNKSDFGSNSSFMSPAATMRYAEPTLMSAGVATRLAGKHFDLIVPDDLWDSDSVSTPDTLSKCKSSIHKLEFLARRGLAIPMVATRYAFDDPTIDLLEHSLYKDNCIILSSIDKDGRAIFPEQRNLKQLKAQDEQSRYEFSSQMMLNPSAESQAFDPAWFRYLPWEEQEAERKAGELRYRTVILTDYAGTSGKLADDCALIAVRCDSKGRIVVCEVIKEKLNPNDAIEKTYLLSDKWAADMIVRQKAPLESSLSSFMEDAQQRRVKEGFKYYHWYEFGLHRMKKEARMLALQPYFQQGQIYFQDNMQDLEHEIQSFPFDMTHDDAMDALSELVDPEVGEIPRFSKVEKTVSDEQLMKEYLDAHRNAEHLQRHQAAKSAWSQYTK